MSMVKVAQMVGRARVDLKKGDKVTLYIKRFNENEVESKIQYIEKRRNCFQDFRTSNSGNDGWFVKKYYHEEQEESHKPKYWIGIDEKASEKFLNEIAVSQTDALLTYYKSMLQEMNSEAEENGDGDNLVGQKYLERMFNWFGHTYAKEADITLNNKNEGLNNLIRFDQSYANAGTQIFAGDKSSFSKKFTELYDDVFPRNQHEPQLATVNETK